jgi:hypothetical protein
VTWVTPEVAYIGYSRERATRQSRVETTSLLAYMANRRFGGGHVAYRAVVELWDTVIVAVGPLRCLATMRSVYPARSDPGP